VSGIQLFTVMLIYVQFVAVWHSVLSVAMLTWRMHICHVMASAWICGYMNSDVSERLFGTAVYIFRIVNV